MIKPCPFCGGDTVVVREGSSFRYRLAECRGCGATGPEVRRQTLGKGTQQQWEDRAIDDALAEWNRRV